MGGEYLVYAELTLVAQARPVGRRFEDLLPRPHRNYYVLRGSARSQRRPNQAR